MLYTGVLPSSRNVKDLVVNVDGAPPAIRMPVSSGSWFAHHAIRKIGVLIAKVPEATPGLKDAGPGLSMFVSCIVLAWTILPSFGSQMTILLSS